MTQALAASPARAATGLRALAGTRATRLVLAGLLAFKLALVGWNAWTYDNAQYDEGHHIWRARKAGLEPGKMAYNPPLYYLPTLPLIAAEGWEPKAVDGKAALRLLRFTNVFWLALFYASWIFVIFPRVLPDRRTRIVASLLLLALPGYQKLGMMAHPDNALAALCGVLVAAWLLLRDRIAAGADWRAVIALAVCTGAVGLTRPFSIVPTGLFWLVTMVELLRAHPIRVAGAAFLRKAVVATLIAGTIAGTWYVVRWARSSTITDAYDDGYISRYVPHRPGFPFLSYFTSFHLGALLEVPNRKINELDRKSPWPRNRYANSFFTTLYSETWGDHWLYASGPTMKEEEAEQKRILFVLALPLVPLLLWRFGRGMAEAIRRGRADRLAPAAVVAAFFVLGAAVYLIWQTGPALLPGKNSTIKFIYVAHLYPLAIALCFLRPVGRWFLPWATYLLVIFGAALPIAIF